MKCEYDQILFSTLLPPGRKGVIQSEGFPNSYPAHANNSWEIVVAKGFLIKFQITDIAITGETGQCKEDKLIVSDKYSTLGEPRLPLLLFYISRFLLFLHDAISVFGATSVFV